MKDHKTYEQLLDENIALRRQLADLQTKLDGHEHVDEEFWREQQKARQYLDVAGVMFAAITADQHVSLINKKGCDILGYPEVEVLGKNWFENFLPVRIREPVKTVFSQLMVGDIEPVEYFENPVLTKDHSERLIAWHNTLLCDDEGHILGTLSSGEDITERKQAEAEISTLNAELEQRVHQRTAELEVVNKELQNFAYVVSHDLKAPLRGISRLACWLAEDYAPLFDEAGKQQVQLLLNRVQRLDDLIEGILQYSRIGRLERESQQVDTNALLAEVIDSLMLSSSIRMTIEQNLPPLHINKTRIMQVFQNLIGNALKFMDKADGEIRIGCLDAGRYWQFSVADNGPGIDPKYHEKIFQIFQVLQPRDELESTGIGLSLVKKS